MPDCLTGAGGRHKELPEKASHPWHVAPGVGRRHEETALPSSIPANQWLAEPWESEEHIGLCEFLGVWNVERQHGALAENGTGIRHSKANHSYQQRAPWAFPPYPLAFNGDTPGLSLWLPNTASWMSSGKSGCRVRHPANLKPVPLAKTGTSWEINKCWVIIHKNNINVHDFILI